MPCLVVAVVPFVFLLLLVHVEELGAGKRPENGCRRGQTAVEVLVEVGLGVGVVDGVEVGVEVEVELVASPLREAGYYAAAEGGARAVLGGCVSQLPRSSGEEEEGRIHAAACYEKSPGR